MGTVFDISFMDEGAPTLLTSSVREFAEPSKGTDQNLKQSDESPADRRKRMNDKVRHAASPCSPDKSMDSDLICYAGTWFDREGTRVGQIEGCQITWAVDACPPSEVRLSSSGDLLVEVDGAFHQATLKNGELHFDDGDVWKKVAPVEQ